MPRRNNFTPQQQLATPNRPAQRLQIRGLLQAGCSVRATAEKVGCDPTTVQVWKKRFRNAETEEDRPRAGRPVKVTPAKKRAIVGTQNQRGKSTRKLAKKHGVSKNTVHRVLTDAGLKPFRQQKVQKISEAGKRKRVEFAKANKKARWDLTLMTDESEVDLNPHRNPKNDVVWAESPESVPAQELQQWAPSVRFWAGACSFGKTKLYFYEGTLNGEAYRKLLKKALPDIKSIFPTRYKNAWIFQHDGASAHKDRLTNEWLEQNVPKFITSGPAGKWPPTSPDLNWIEDLWGILTEKLKSYSTPVQNVKQLKTRLRKCWTAISIETLQKCASSMPTRLQQVIDGNGDALRR